MSTILKIETFTVITSIKNHFIYINIIKKEKKF